MLEGASCGPVIRILVFQWLILWSLNFTRFLIFLPAQVGQVGNLGYSLVFTFLLEILTAEIGYFPPCHSLEALTKPQQVRLWLVSPEDRLCWEEENALVYFKVVLFSFRRKHKWIFLSYCESLVEPEDERLPLELMTHALYTEPPAPVSEMPALLLGTASWDVSALWVSVLVKYPSVFARLSNLGRSV